MRVLLVSPYPVAPPHHGGRVRVAGLARGWAAAGADVEVLAPWHPASARTRRLAPAVALRTHLRLVSALPAVTRDRLAPAQALLSLEPSRRAIRRVLARLGSFDVVQFEFCAHARWMNLIDPGTTVIYSAHNVERDFHAAEAVRFLVRDRALRRIERLEELAVRRADLCLTCSDADAERLRELYGAESTVVVPNGAQPGLSGPYPAALRERARARLGLAPGERAIVFVGGGAQHNLDAVRFLEREVLPALGPGVRLVLAGDSAPRAVRDPRLISLPRVQDLRALLAAADVGVNPVSFGSGTSVKVADYLAGGLPVVATPAGARGLPATPGLHVVPREEMVDLLSNGLPARAPGGAGDPDGGWARLVHPLAQAVGASPARSREG